MSKKQKARIKDLEAMLADAVTMMVVMRGDMRVLESEGDALRHDLGECQAGREALQRYIDDLAPVAVWKAHAKETDAYADEMKAENAELKKELIAMQNVIETAHRWKTYADSIESQIEILQTAIDARDERLDNIKFFLSDGDE